MGPFALAWLVGEGIICYRWVKKTHIPPGPGQLLYSSGLFVLLALLAESESARPLAITLAWGFDIAAFMNLFNGGMPKPGNAANWPPDLMSNTQIFPTKTPAPVTGGGGPAPKQTANPVPNSGGPVRSA